MKEFYQDILRRNPRDTTPLEKVILWECSREEGLASLHAHRIRQMLKDICQRKNQATAADGCDWVVATFERILELALKYGSPMTKEEMLALPPCELRMRRTAQQNKPAAQAYQHLKHGSTCQNNDAERTLLRLYESIIGRMEPKICPPDIADVHNSEVHNRC